MADISKCKGYKCPLKKKCYRFTAPESLVWQSYSDFDYNKDKRCFWDNTGYDKQPEKEKK
jgi:hypothetical protein